MHPAASIIAFTTLSGLGYGLAAVLSLGLLDPAAVATRAAHILALAMISGGLLASTLHLGNPQRAWRALSQWRSSWLSREGAMSILTFVPLLFSAWFSVVEGRWLPVAGILGAVMCAMTVYCTAMIYASLRSIQAWNTQLTPLCYLLFALSGGLLLATVAQIAAGGSSYPISLAAAISIAAAWTAKQFWWTRLRTMLPLSSAESATGLGGIGKVRLFERPHMTENYLTNEMGYRIGRKHARKLSLLALVAGGALPAIILLLVAIGENSTAALVAVCAAMTLYGLGLVVERWLFFAEARHAVMNYYGG